MPSGAKFYRESAPMPCVPASFLEVSYLTCCVFFLPFFYDFGGILPSGNADGGTKIGSGPPKSDAALSQDILSQDLEFLHSSSFYASNTPVTNIPGSGSTSTDLRSFSSPTCARGAFLQRSRERLSHFRFLSSCFYPGIGSRWESTTRRAAPNG